MALIDMSQNHLIFVVAVIRTSSEFIRTVALTYNLPDAIRVVEKNIGDISDDGHYDMAVIEVIPEGVYPTAMNQYWYEWKRGKFISVKKPERYKMFGRMSM